MRGEKSNIQFFPPKDKITLENEGDYKQKTVVSFSCHNIALNSISVKKPWDMEPEDPRWSFCSVADWPFEDKTDKARNFS